MDFAADLDIFFIDCGLDAVVDDGTPDGRPVRLIFDRPYARAPGFEGALESVAPQAVLTDAAAAGIAQNDRLTIAGADYYVLTREPDGAGLTVLILSTSPPVAPRRWP